MMRTKGERKRVGRGGKRNERKGWGGRAQSGGAARSVGRDWDIRIMEVRQEHRAGGRLGDGEAGTIAGESVSHSERRAREAGN